MCWARFTSFHASFTTVISFLFFPYKVIWECDSSFRMSSQRYIIISKTLGVSDFLQFFAFLSGRWREQDSSTCFSVIPEALVVLVPSWMPCYWRVWCGSPSRKLGGSKMSRRVFHIWQNLMIEMEKTQIWRILYNVDLQQWAKCLKVI